MMFDMKMKDKSDFSSSLNKESQKDTLEVFHSRFLRETMRVSYDRGYG